MTTEDSIIFYAFRYALGRHTYAVSDVAQYIIANKHKLHIKTKAMMVKEIDQHHAQFGDGGFECDSNEWMNVIKALQE